MWIVVVWTFVDTGMFREIKHKLEVPEEFCVNSEKSQSKLEDLKENQKSVSEKEIVVKVARSRLLVS